MDAHNNTHYIPPLVNLRRGIPELRGAVADGHCELSAAFITFISVSAIEFGKAHFSAHLSANRFLDLDLVWPYSRPPSIVAP
jgi:hypothetical protein